MLDFAVYGGFDGVVDMGIDIVCSGVFKIIIVFYVLLEGFEFREVVVFTVVVYDVRFLLVMGRGAWSRFRRD